MKRHAEIAGAGFAGLTVAIALLQRGWTARVHERSASLRAEGFGIAIQQNGLRTLQALGLDELTLQRSIKIQRRVLCDSTGKATADLGISKHQIRISRKLLIEAMASKISELGGEIIANSEVSAAEIGGELQTTTGRKLKADVIIAADGQASVVRKSVGLVPRVRMKSDGALRLVIRRQAEEVPPEGPEFGVTVENWAGHRRLIYSPCSRDELYVAMSCLASDATGTMVPIDFESWRRSLPHLNGLFDRIREEANWSVVKWDRFKTIALPSWSAGKIAVVGDAAHAMPPNLAQGGGCAMMNALSLATSLAESTTVLRALKEWERRERRLIEHTQRWSSLYGAVTSWSEGARTLAFAAVERSSWLQRQLQMAARHPPYGWRERVG